MAIVEKKKKIMCKKKFEKTERKAFTYVQGPASVSEPFSLFRQAVIL